MAGAADGILRTLETFGLTWDGNVYYQSRQLERYQTRLDFLEKKQLLYPCTCSRKTLGQSSQTERYPGICQNRTFPQSSPYATRIRVEDSSIEFYDKLHGTLSENLATGHGDFIIKRKDRVFAYQFAVVIDDYVTHVVRGADLLDSTPKQIYLQQHLGLLRPKYMHVPLITDHRGNKLSKQTFAKAVDQNNPRHVLFKLLELLRQSPPAELAEYSVAEILDWGVTHWKPASLSNIGTICPGSNSFQHLTVD